MRVIRAFKSAFKMIKGDKLAIFLSLLPVALGATGFYFLFRFIFNYTRERIEELLTFISGAGAGLLSGMLLTPLALVIVNFSFVLVVSLVACPFNDLLSGRIEKKMRGSVEEDTGRNFFARILGIWSNELKKILFIGTIGALALLLGFFPFLYPLYLVISALLLAVNFLDYSWSRHQLSLSDCLRDVRNSCFLYGFAGLLFLLAMAIPILNILLLPYGVVYFTILYVEKQHPDAKLTKS